MKSTVKKSLSISSIRTSGSETSFSNQCFIFLLHTSTNSNLSNWLLMSQSFSDFFWIGMHKPVIPITQIRDTHLTRSILLVDRQETIEHGPLSRSVSTVQNCTRVRARNFVVGRTNRGNKQHTTGMDATGCRRNLF